MTPPLHPPADDAHHLLVVDDDRRIRTLVSRYLREQGYRVTTAASGFEARALLEMFVFDLLVLDVMMPGESGFDLARAIRLTAPVPIMMLTARSEANSRIQGLEAGADDYLAKPFEPRELSLRIASILRRVAAALPPAVERISFGGFTFDLATQELRQGTDIIRLTDREKEMLKLLGTAPGETIPRHQLAASEDLGDRSVDVQVNRLRRKIETDPANPIYLQTVRGIGYRLVASP